MGKVYNLFRELSDRLDNFLNTPETDPVWGWEGAKHNPFWSEYRLQASRRETMRALRYQIEVYAPKSDSFYKNLSQEDDTLRKLRKDLKSTRKDREVLLGLLMDFPEKFYLHQPRWVFKNDGESVTLAGIVFHLLDTKRDKPTQGVGLYWDEKNESFTYQVGALEDWDNHLTTSNLSVALEYLDA